MVEFGHKLDEKMKVTLSKIKKNLQRTNCEGKEARIQINDLELFGTERRNKTSKKMRMV